MAPIIPIAVGTCVAIAIVLTIVNRGRWWVYPISVFFGVLGGLVVGIVLAIALGIVLPYKVVHTQQCQLAPIEGVQSGVYVTTQDATNSNDNYTVRYLYSCQGTSGLTPGSAQRDTHVEINVKYDAPAGQDRLNVYTTTFTDSNYSNWAAEEPTTIYVFHLSSPKSLDRHDTDN